MNLAMPEYLRPPIVESVIEIKFAEQATERAVRKISSKLAKEFPTFEELSKFNVSMQSPSAKELNTKAQYSFYGYKRANKDADSVVLLYTDIIAYAKLAPYPGWNIFKDNFIEVYRKAKDLVKSRTIIRIGLRYINRIDIPVSSGQPTPDGEIIIRTEDYLLLHPELPKAIDVPFRHFTLQARIAPKGTKFNLTLNVAVIPPPLPNHAAVLFDIDLSLSSNIPQQEKPLLDTLDEMREQKNLAFEACITDKARELFGA